MTCSLVSCEKPQDISVAPLYLEEKVPMRLFLGQRGKRGDLTAIPKACRSAVVSVEVLSKFLAEQKHVHGGKVRNTVRNITQNSCNPASFRYAPQRPGKNPVQMGMGWGFFGVRWCRQV